MDVQGGMKTQLQPGRYRVEVDIIYGNSLVQAQSELSVGTTPDATYWI